MKIRRSKSLILFFVFSLMNLSMAQSFTFVERNLEVMLKNTTDAYNKNSFDFSKTNLDKKFIKDFAKISKNKTPWKAELIGNTVYFKKKRGMFKIQFTKMKSVRQFSMTVNGKSFDFNGQESFQKNYDRLKYAMMVRKASVWSFLVPQANALEIEAPEEMEDQLSSAMSWSTWAWSWFDSESDLQQNRICNLNKEEIKSYNPAPDREILLSEIKFLVQIQEKYTRALLRDHSAMRECGSYVCVEAREFQSCIMELAKRRKEEITRAGTKGFECFEKMQDGYSYLNSDLIDATLVNFEGSFEAKVENLEKMRKTCLSKLDSETCLKRTKKNLETVLESCPQNEDTIYQIQKACGNPNLVVQNSVLF